MKKVWFSVLMLMVLCPMAASAALISLAPPAGSLNNYTGSDPHNGRGVIFDADMDFTMSSFGMDAQWSGLFDFTLDVYDWNGNTRGALLSSSSFSDIADPGAAPFLALNHTHDFMSGNRYEVIVRYSNPGVSFNYYSFSNPTLADNGFAVGNYLTVIDGTDFNNNVNNFWFVNFTMDVDPTNTQPPTSVPEPSLFTLFGASVIALGLSRRRKKTA